MSGLPTRKTTGSRSSRSPVNTSRCLAAKEQNRRAEQSRAVEIDPTATRGWLTPTMTGYKSGYRAQPVRLWRKRQRRSRDDSRRPNHSYSYNAENQLTKSRDRTAPTKKPPTTRLGKYSRKATARVTNNVRAQLARRGHRSHQPARAKNREDLRHRRQSYSLTDAKGQRPTTPTIQPTSSRSQLLQRQPLNGEIRI